MICESDACLRNGPEEVLLSKTAFVGEVEEFEDFEEDGINPQPRTGLELQFAKKFFFEVVDIHFNVNI